MRRRSAARSRCLSDVTPEQRVRADHPLRPIRRMTDAVQTRLSSRLRPPVRDDGRPLIPPEQLLRALPLQMLYSIRSERLLVEELDYSVSIGGSRALASTIRSGTRRRSRKIGTACSTATSPTRSSQRRSPRSRPTASVGRTLHGRRDAARGVGEPQEFQAKGRSAHPPR